MNGGFLSRTTGEKNAKSHDHVALGDVIFDVRDGTLQSKSGATVPLRKQSKAVLRLLLERAGETVSKSEIFETVWPQTHVTDDSLVQCVADIRRAIGPTGSTLIETAPKHGYRYVPQQSGGKSRRIRWLAVAMVPILVLVGLWLLSSADLPDRPTIAVLAFEDMSNEPDNGYLNDAIVEGITIELARFEEIAVVARNSSFQYRNSAIDVREIGRDLNAQYVLEGSQQRDEDSLRVHARLVDATTGTDIWSESYERPIAQFFDVQAEIVRAVVAAVGFRVAYNPPPSGGLNTLSALQYHLEGRTYIRQVTPDATDKAEELNLLAISVDPASPYGYVGMGYVFRHRYSHGWGTLPADETLATARSYAQTALEIAPNNYSTHALMGRIHFQSGEIEQAIARFEHAISLNPSATNILMALAWVHTHSGRGAEALELIEIAMTMDPHHPPWFFWDEAKAQWETGDCTEANKTIQRMPRIPIAAYKLLAAIHICEGRRDEAIRIMSDYMQEHPTHSISRQRSLDTIKYSTPQQLDRWLDALRAAGMPD